MSDAKLIWTLDGKGFPNVYVYLYRGQLFGVAKTWRSSPAGWNVRKVESYGDEGITWGESFAGYRIPTTRKEAVARAVDEIDWRLRPGVSEEKLAELIAEDWERTAGR